MHPAPKLATYEDLLSFPEGTRTELLSGEILMSPAPAPAHLNVRGAIRRFIGGPFHDEDDDDDGYGDPGGWWILTEADVELRKHDVVRPDACGWRRTNL